MVWLPDGEQIRTYVYSFWHNPRTWKNAVFMYRSPHFCFPWGRPWGSHAKYCMDGKRIRRLQIVSQHVLMYLQQFPSYSNRKWKKIAVFTYRSPHFCFPWGRPWGNHAKCCMDGKRIRYLQIVSLHGAHLTITVSEIERDIGRKLSFFHTPLHSTPPLAGFPSE